MIYINNSIFESIKHIDENNNEYWFARELMSALEYSKWERFSNALEKALEEHSNWHVLAQDCGEFTKAKSREIMKRFLEEVNIRDVDVIYCENDEEAFGAMAALNEAGLGYGNGTNLKIISFDATESALEFCMSGQIDLVVECNPLQGPYLYNIIEMLKDGKTVPKITYVDENYFTSENLSTEIIQSRKY